MIHVASAYHNSTADSSDARSPHLYLMYSLDVISFICTFYMRRTCLPRLHRRQRKHANSIHKHDIFSLYTFFYIYILYTSCIYFFSILIAPACHDSTADIRVARSPHIKFIYSLHILSFICISYTHRTCMPRLHGRQLSCAISVHKYGRFSSYISILMHTTYTSHLHAKTLLQTAEVLNLHMYISNMIFIDFR